MSLLKELIKLRDEGPTFRRYGICTNVFDEHDELSDLFAEWPEFSGSLKYPVPAYCSEYDDAADAFNTAGAEMWDPDHPYGAARLRLLAFCIETLQAQAK
jgi:hypothetical protein